ncbi:hypothetical protein Tco_0193920 [Tanacetum coccineum]
MKGYVAKEKSECGEEDCMRVSEASEWEEWKRIVIGEDGKPLEPSRLANVVDGHINVQRDSGVTQDAQPLQRIIHESTDKATPLPNDSDHDNNQDVQTALFKRGHEYGDQRDGFTEVRRKGSNPRKFDGVYVYKKLVYCPIVKQASTNMYVDVHAGDDSDSDVEIVYYEIGNFMDAKHSKSESGYGNKSLYERWKETLDDDDYDPYNDDEYNTHRLSEQQEAFCDALDIKFRDRKKIPSIKQSQSRSLVQSTGRLKRDRATLSVDENRTKTLMCNCCQNVIRVGGEE